MDDEEDVKKMIDLIKSSKEDTTQDFQYDDFINCENSDIEENEDSIYFDINYDFNNFTSTDISKLSSYDPGSILKLEERAAIDSGSDSILKNLLLLNRTKNFQLMQLYKKLKDLLLLCQKNIKEKKEVINNFLKANKDQTHSSGAWRLAAPYFKDKKLYACPPNVDTLRKQRNKELSVYDVTVTVKWSSLECDKLLRAVKVNYNINQQNDALKKIRTLQKSGNKDELAELKRRMEELQNEDNSEIPPLNSDQHIDWMRVAEVFLQDRRTPFECKSFWHIYLHPQISKLPWTPEENAKLKNLVKKYKYQNWDRIAKELGTNRTGFTTCMNYYGNLHEKFKRGDFTYEEDCRLAQLVHKHRMGNYIPWVKIVQHFKNRTRAQLHHRYTYYLTQNDKRKGKFTDAEDILLMILVDKFGKNFKKCSEYLPTRSMVQIKSRYSSNLQQKLKKGSFSEEEDKIIMKYVEEHGQKSWAKLTKVLQRCRGQIRQRYNTIISYLAKNPNSSLEIVPRRKHNLKEEEESFNFLRMVADQFADSPNIPSLQEIEKILRSHHEEELTEKEFNIPLNIDDMLTNFFCNTFKINPTKYITAMYVKRAVKDVEEVLDILNADLDIPHDFDEDLKLDNLDVAILNVLYDKMTNKRKTNKDVCKLLPPNLNSLVGLRGLLIKYHANKLDQHETEDIDKYRHRGLNIKSDIVKQLLNLSNDTRTKVDNDHKLFCRRFHSLFKWPAIMTLEGPSSEVQGTSSCSFSPTKIQVERTYSRADKNKAKEFAEKQMSICELPSSSMEAAPLKLTPVTNKSIIEDLMHNRDKKLFCMEAVKSDGETKMVIKEVDFHSCIGATSNNENNTNSTSNHQVRLINSRITETNCYKPSKKKRKLSQFIPGQEDCIVMNTENDDYMSDDADMGDNIADDLKDLNKLEIFLKDQQCKEMSNEDDDLEDLKKLEHFLKLQDKEIDFEIHV